MPNARYAACFAAASKAAGRELTHDELDALFERTQRRMDRLVREGMSEAEAAMEAGKQLGSEARSAAARVQFEKARNLLVRAQLKKRVVDGDEYRSIAGILSGEQSNRRGAAMSVHAKSLNRIDQMTNVLAHDLKKAGLWDAIRRRDRDFEADLARELWRRNDPNGTVQPTGNRHAEEAARIVGDVQERVRKAQNKAGAWIRKLDGFVTTQSHDAWRVRGKGDDASFAEWRNTILPELDERTFDEVDPGTTIEQYLKRTWQALASGVHESLETADWLTGFKGPANLAKRASQERKLIFKSPDGWLRYNAKYGVGPNNNGNVFDSIVRGIERGAKNSAILEELGTNPGAMYGSLIRDAISQAKDRNDFKMVDRLRRIEKGGLLDTLMGRGIPPGDRRLVQVATEVRAFQQLTKLGGVAISSLSDLATVASVARHQGIPILQAYRDAVFSLAPGWLDKGAKYRRETAELLGIGTQGILADVMHRFSPEDGPMGMASRMLNRFYKFNGLSYWTESVANGAALMFTRNLAKNAGTDFRNMNKRLQASLLRYGIGESEWNVVRQAVQKMPDGNEHIFADQILSLPDDDTAGALRDGETPATAKQRLRDSVSTYVTDQVREAMTEPDLGTQAMTRGAYSRMDEIHPALGQAMRMVMQFKTFPLSYVRRTYGREVQRDGLDVPGAIHIIAASTLLGYIAMSAKGILQGKEPRDPTDPRTMLAAMQQGGGLGIYGDFLFGESSRSGSSFLETLGGPTLGDLSNIANLVYSGRDWATSSAFDQDGGPSTKSVEAGLLRQGVSEIPFGNLPFVNMAIKQLLLYRLQDTINPGYTKRFERAAKKNSGQTFFLRPSWSPYQAMGLTQ